MPWAGWESSRRLCLAWDEAGSPWKAAFHWEGPVSFWLSKQENWRRTDVVYVCKEKASAPEFCLVWEDVLMIGWCSAAWPGAATASAPFYWPKRGSAIQPGSLAAGTPAEKNPHGSPVSLCPPPSPLLPWPLVLPHALPRCPHRALPHHSQARETNAFLSVNPQASSLGLKAQKIIVSVVIVAALMLP